MSGGAAERSAAQRGPPVVALAVEPWQPVHRQVELRDACAGAQGWGLLPGGVCWLQCRMLPSLAQCPQQWQITLCVRVPSHSADYEGTGADGAACQHACARAPCRRAATMQNAVHSLRGAWLTMQLRRSQRKRPSNTARSQQRAHAPVCTCRGRHRESGIVEDQDGGGSGRRTVEHADEEGEEEQGEVLAAVRLGAVRHAGVEEQQDDKDADQDGLHRPEAVCAAQALVRAGCRACMLSCMVCTVFRLPAGHRR